MKKPIIGISGNINVLNGGRFPGYRQSYVNEDYIKSVELACGVPLILPVTNDLEVITSYLEIVDALILSGGYDVSPLTFGEQPLRNIGDTMPERDHFDQLLIKEALKLEMPILGICRGLQILNVTLGGTLYQDLEYIPHCDIKHDQWNDSSKPTHEVSLLEGSKIHQIMNLNRLKINSFHHMAIKDLGEGLEVTAKSDDGVIEVIEHKEYPFVIGVQWHPEMMASTNGQMLGIIEALISAIPTQRFGQLKSV